MTKAFADILPSFLWFVEGLKHVCRLLTRRWSKQRLVASCYSTGLALAYASDIENFHALVKEARWGQVMAAAMALLPLWAALRRNWDKATDVLVFGIECKLVRKTLQEIY